MSLRTDNMPGEDTRLAVREVLSFVADALCLFEANAECIADGSLSGAGRVVSLCYDALREADAGNEADQ
ncbi:hypothetical protein [Accumulibacter sp.]|uniref:hypothetical protein n=1 Tax=Accumulibacter sp. TaxID=2053492 RepID=UPI001A42AF13|nr:hypothetical protein [Accumulibacter sp.]MBL8373795.1 hypothetical protein [Accumulibacter sp.]